MLRVVAQLLEKATLFPQWLCWVFLSPADHAHEVIDGSWSNPRLITRLTLKPSQHTASKTRLAASVRAALEIETQSFAGPQRLYLHLLHAKPRANAGLLAYALRNLFAADTEYTIASLPAIEHETDPSALVEAFAPVFGE